MPQIYLLYPVVHILWGSLHNFQCLITRTWIQMGKYMSSEKYSTVYSNHIFNCNCYATFSKLAKSCILCTLFICCSFDTRYLKILTQRCDHVKPLLPSWNIKKQSPRLLSCEITMLLQGHHQTIFLFSHEMHFAKSIGSDNKAKRCYIGQSVHIWNC